MTLRPGGGDGKILHSSHGGGSPGLGSVGVSPASQTCFSCLCPNKSRRQLKTSLESETVLIQVKKKKVQEARNPLRKRQKQVILKHHKGIFLCFLWSYRIKLLASYVWRLYRVCKTINEVNISTNKTASTSYKHILILNEWHQQTRTLNSLTSVLRRGLRLPAPLRCDSSTGPSESRFNLSAEECMFEKGVCVCARLHIY